MVVKLIAVAIIVMVIVGVVIVSTTIAIVVMIVVLISSVVGTIVSLRTRVHVIAGIAVVVIAATAAHSSASTWNIVAASTHFATKINISTHKLNQKMHTVFSFLLPTEAPCFHLASGTGFDSGKKINISTHIFREKCFEITLRLPFILMY